MSEKIWSDDAWNDYLYWQTQDKKTLKRINQLIKDIERNGAMHGIGDPEPLKGDLQGEHFSGSSRHIYLLSKSEYLSPLYNKKRCPKRESMYFHQGDMR